jgi:hypothetical protein
MGWAENAGPWLFLVGALTAATCSGGNGDQPGPGGSGGSAGDGAAGVPGSTDRCLLPREEGTCSIYGAAYYFDDDFDWCEGFNYSGCGGNDNRFATREECEAACITGKPECASGTDVPEEQCGGAYARGLCFASEEAACACDGCGLDRCTIRTMGVSPSPKASCSR